ncbi:MAG: adenosine deaminase [Bacteroidetes bacterium]|nr:adenosine deaminase [Bacteroidota bacterium]MBU1717932.1 adenosine deaminase [Bacteroidota bacterium]
MEELIRKIPKAELHIHIEGSFEPELMFEIAKRNQVSIPYKSVDDLRKAYNFNNLQEFLDIYYAGANALQNEADFYDLTYAYMLKAAEQNILHTEIFFDPQTHTERGIRFETVLSGICHALEDSRKNLGVSSNLIVCILRHLSAVSGMETLEMAIRHKDKIIGIGLDSSEVGHPPVKFAEVYKRAKEEGFVLVAHAGEEGPPEFVWEALNVLQIDRLDHGNRSLEDESLVAELVKRNIALTVCPLSNYKLAVVKDLTKHPLKLMLDKGMFATINSDDPAYFGGYLNENYQAMYRNLNLSKEEIIRLAKNSFLASFLPEAKKQRYLNLIDEIAG